MPSAQRDLGCGHTAVETQRHARVSQIVWPGRQRRRDLRRCRNHAPRRRPRQPIGRLMHVATAPRPKVSLVFGHTLPLDMIPQQFDDLGRDRNPDGPRCRGGASTLGAPRCAVIGNSGSRCCALRVIKIRPGPSMVWSYEIRQPQLRRSRWAHRDVSEAAEEGHQVWAASVHRWECRK